MSKENFIMFSIQTFIIHIYIAALQYFLVYFLFSRYKNINPRIDKTKLFVLMSLITLIQSFFDSFEYFIINVVVTAILFLIVSLFFFRQWQDILYSWIIATAVIDIGEGVAAMSLTSTGLTSQDIGIFLSNSVNTVLLFTVARLISLALIVFILRYRRIKGNALNLPTIYWLSFLFITMKDMLWILILLDSSKEISFFYWAAVVPLLPISYILFYYTRRSIERMIKVRVDNKVLDEKNKYYEQQLIMIKQTLETQKIVRHDLKNKLAPLVYLAENDNKEELISHIKKIGDLSVLGKIYADSGNITIDYIINLKLQALANKGVKVSCEINVPNDIDIAPFDLSAILGNLIDNAAEALYFVKNNKWVSLNISYQVGILIIQVANTFDGIVHLHDGKIVSRKNDSENHGYGLNSIEVTVKKYNGKLEITYDNNIFNTTVKMFS